MQMDKTSAERWVVISAFVVAAIYAYRRLTEPPVPPVTLKKLAGIGALPPVGSFATAWGFAFLVVSIMAEAAPGLGGGFAILIATSDLLTNSQSVFTDVAAAQAGTLQAQPLSAPVTNIAGSITSAATSLGASAASFSGGTLDKAKLQALWIAAGGSPSAAPTAAAVALAESSGIPTQRYNPGPQEDSRGLWQINLVSHGNYSSSNLYDPLTNAKAAIAISGNGSNWGPWTTYTSGKYRSFL